MTNKITLKKKEQTSIDDALSQFFRFQELLEISTYRRFTEWEATEYESILKRIEYISTNIKE